MEKRFKFRHKDIPDSIYTAVKCQQAPVLMVAWINKDGSVGVVEYSLSEAKFLFEKGTWIIVK